MLSRTWRTDEIEEMLGECEREAASGAALRPARRVIAELLARMESAVTRLDDRVCELERLAGLPRR